MKIHKIPKINFLLKIAKKGMMIKMNEYFEKTRAFWGGEIVRGNLVWPDEHVIRFIKRNFKIGARILDFGCGAGRNAIAFAKDGYDVVAMDYTSEALLAVQSKASDACLHIETVKNLGLEVPLEENSVDAIIADGSLFYNNAIDTIMLLRNLIKCLKPSGKIWANWRTENDSLIEKGVALGDGLYRLNEASKRDGCCYFFCNEEKLRDIYKQAGASIEFLDLFEYTENNMQSKCSWYHVTAYK